MRLVALDTTARAGSVALAIDGRVIEARTGDASRTHGERLPGVILDLLTAHGLRAADVDVYAVAAGPGSFTGLRVGIASVQGLALAHSRRVVAVSALDALAHIAARDRSSSASLTGALIDAQRGEIFGALYRAKAEVAAPLVASPGHAIAEWEPLLAGGGMLAVGDGAARYRDVLQDALGERVRFSEPLIPPLAPAIAEMAYELAASGATIAPHAIVPMYIRRPDAERARRKKNTEVRIQNSE
jgi:tRNA threonylcarbamoyladenosine biosynthesis protein TsaB